MFTNARMQYVDEIQKINKPGHDMVVDTTPKELLYTRIKIYKNLRQEY